MASPLFVCGGGEKSGGAFATKAQGLGWFGFFWLFFWHFFLNSL